MAAPGAPQGCAGAGLARPQPVVVNAAANSLIIQASATESRNCAACSKNSTGRRAAR